MLDNTKLLIKFQDKAAKADIYLRNRLLRGLVIKEKITSLEQAFTREMPRCKCIRAQGSKSYNYINPKTLPKNARHDKLILKKQEGVFIRYLEIIEKQFKIYAPNFRYIYRINTLYIDKAVKGGTVNLRFQNYPSSPQGILNQLPN